MFSASSIVSSTRLPFIASYRENGVEKAQKPRCKTIIVSPRVSRSRTLAPFQTALTVLLEPSDRFLSPGPFSSGGRVSAVRSGKNRTLTFITLQTFTGFAKM